MKHKSYLHKKLETMHETGSYIERTPSDSSLKILAVMQTQTNDDKYWRLTSITGISCKLWIPSIFQQLIIISINTARLNAGNNLIYISTIIINRQCQSNDHQTHPYQGLLGILHSNQHQFRKWQFSMTETFYKHNEFLLEPEVKP